MLILDPGMSGSSSHISSIYGQVRKIGERDPVERVDAVVWRVERDRVVLTEHRYDATADRFAVDTEMPFFPLEGMFTRVIHGPPGDLPVLFIETSAPGLMGHSGGPLLDIHGRVWGIQSKTSHLPLGFRDEIVVAGEKIKVPPQFINLGQAVHPETLTALLNKKGIAFEMSTD